MKTFLRNRTLEELRAACAVRGWTVHTEKYEQGSDYVSFYWSTRHVSGLALVSMFNGQMMGEFFHGGPISPGNGEQFSSQTPTHEHEPWFNDLLEVVFTNERAEP